MKDAPPAVTRFVEAFEQRDHDALAACFTQDATVTVAGETHQGRDAIRAWQRDVRRKFEYTFAVKDAGPIRPGAYRVVAHLSGHFPGGETDVTYSFTMRDGLIATLAVT